MNWELNALPPVAADVEPVAIVEAVEPARESARKRLKLKANQAFRTLGEALANVDADAVLLTTPIDAHIPLAIEAMRAGKHVLTEKPMATTLDEAVEAINVARETGRILQVSQNYRFYPAPRKATQLVRERVLGDLGTVKIDFRKWGNSAEPGTNRHYQFVQPLLYDMSIHHFDLMRLVLSQEPTSVFVQGTDPEWSNFVEPASATVIVTMSGGTVVSYRGSWVSSDADTLWGGEWRMECADGLIGWRSRDNSGTKSDAVWTRTRDGNVTDIALAPMPLWGRSASVQSFCRAIETGEEPENSARNNLGSIALMFAAARSLASGQVEEVTIPDV